MVLLFLWKTLYRSPNLWYKHDASGCEGCILARRPGHFVICLCCYYEPGKRLQETAAEEARASGFRATQA